MPLMRAALARLQLSDRFAEVTVVLDELAADERAWLHLAGTRPDRRLTIWLHPDQFLRERMKPAGVEPGCADWRQGPIPSPGLAPSPDDFSLLNTQRTLYQQLLLVRDLLDGRLKPDSLASETSEAFQEAWLVTIDGRLHGAGLPHWSIAQRRLRFLHVFAAGAVLTPSHWAVFNQLWHCESPDQDAVIERIRLLPPLRRGMRR